MIEQLKTLFNDPKNILKIQSKLPLLFHMANLESMRAGKIGMEVGTIRERILSSMLIHYFGEGHVDTDIPTTEAEIDVKLFGQPISIKTITASGNSLTGFKLSWTVDAASARTFASHYMPSCELLFTRIRWNNQGALYYIPIEVQIRVFNELGAASYLKLPVAGTNPRGVEITGLALRKLCDGRETQTIDIDWTIPDIQINIFEKWVDLWEQD